MELVETLAQVEENARRFAEVKDAKQSDAFKRLGRFFHWYFFEPDILAPSKFIGYKNTTIINYRGEGKGTRTQEALAQWFVKLKPDDKKYNDAMSKLRGLLSSCGQQVCTKVTSGTGGIYVPRTEVTITPRLLSDLEADEEYIPDGVDQRKSIEGSIKARRGQRQFRDALLLRYHRQCVATECKIVAILEAAHISRYLGDKDDAPSNGLLLRADIHTLFDLNLLGIKPEALRIELNPAIAGDPTYKRLAGKSLKCDPNAQPSKAALIERYKLFIDRKVRDSNRTAVF